MLDGITIMNGETMTELSTHENTGGEMDEIGRGGAIYTDRVHYTLNRCLSDEVIPVCTVERHPMPTTPVSTSSAAT